MANLTLFRLWLEILTSARVRVVGHSMLPTLWPDDRLLVNGVVLHLRHPRRGELVLLTEPDRPDVLAIKRVVGLPGERVALADGLLYVNLCPRIESYAVLQAEPGTTETWRLGQDEYLTLGDNRRDARDSRRFGPVPRSSLRGAIRYRYWPAARAGFLD